MTNNITLEERTKSRIESIETLMRNAIKLGRQKYRKGSDIEAINSQNLALYEQNQLMIDYLQEIYKLNNILWRCAEQLGENKK